MARTKRGERTVSEVLDAARVLLLEQGPEGLSLREVARRAGLAPSALYNHFRDRDELVTAVAIQSVGTLAGYLQAVPPGPAPERLRALGHAYADFAQDHPSEYRVVFDCLVNPPHEWDAYLEVAHPFSIIVNTCAEGLADGSLRDPSGLGAGGIAYALWVLVDGHVHLRSRHLSAIEGPFAPMFSAALGALIASFTEREDPAPPTEQPTNARPTRNR